ncbi:MAG: ergothioneine biosynthesis protein EgtB [Myxococcales bacterium]|nr:ergothioneine biosynthesis protein EgtB [Myxococcales bacterium]
MGGSAALQHVLGVRKETTRRCEPLSVEDYVVQSMPDASPTKWHLAHTSWFFEEFVLGPLGVPPHDDRYRYLFNSYYEAVGPRHPRPERGLLTRPTVSEVLDYRRAVDARLADLAGSDALDAAADALWLGAHHEQQHQELILTDLKHAFSKNPLLPAYRSDDAGPAGYAPGPAAYRAFEGGVVEIGDASAGFAFDNELPRHRVLLEPFEIADRLVTCAELLEFIRDGGYTRPDHWLSDGWAWVQREGIRAPLYWLSDGDAEPSRELTLRGAVPIDPSAPVTHVSFYEADAFARWSQKRLPLETEWEHAASDFLSRGGDMTGTFSELHPRAAPAASRDSGGPVLRQLFGDTWEWTASPYVAYPGFRPLAGAFGEYNGKFMCNQLVLRGGSCATPIGHVRPSYRNFFPPEARWQFTGIRLAR